MSTVYSDSNTSAVTGISLQVATGLSDHRICRCTYYVKMKSPALAGLIYFVFRWTDRDGTAQVHTSASLAAASMARVGAVVPFWTEDASGQGAYSAYEIITVGVLGSYEYEYAVDIDDTGQGN
jgi:hypothetical protein